MWARFRRDVANSRSARIVEDGVMHTVALPDPTRVMSDGFRASLDILVAGDRAALCVNLERAETQPTRLTGLTWSGRTFTSGLPLQKTCFKADLRRRTTSPKSSTKSCLVGAST
jgi:hypothetical protein